jgi:hemin uptake protein HemP
LILSLTTLIGNARKRKKLLTCTQETIRVKLERLHSARLFHGDQKIITRHAMALSKAKGLISLLAPIK